MSLLKRNLSMLILLDLSVAFESADSFLPSFQNGFFFGCISMPTLSCTASNLKGQSFLSFLCWLSCSNTLPMSKSLLFLPYTIHSPCYTMHSYILILILPTWYCWLLTCLKTKLTILYLLTPFWPHFNKCYYHIFNYLCQKVVMKIFWIRYW